MEIITCVCIDKSPENSNDKYLTLPRTNSAKRRQLFWQCAAVFYASSIRCNPTYKHILYTNDQDHVFFNGLDLNKLLTEIGVEIRQLPFKKFVPPPDQHTIYRNAFYKNEVICSLPSDTECSVIIDSDCVWSRPIEGFEETMSNGNLFLIDTYHVENPHAKILGISRKDLGEMYRTIDPAYPELAPVWFGGEFMAGQNRLLSAIGKELKALFDEVICDSVKRNVQLPNGRRILDGMEYFTSMIVNKHIGQWKDATPFSRRIWTINNNVLEQEWKTPIWHLLQEKQIGFPMLFSKVIDSSSKFWSTPIDGFADYLGGFVGVPRRKQFSWKATESEIRSRTKDIVRRIMSPFGSSFRQEFKS
jgi:hypothetical protein